MSVWFVIPSARPPEQVEPVLAAWRDRGYKIAILWDSVEPSLDSLDFQMHVEPYPGYAQSVNLLAKEILESDPSCDWIVTGGDDTLPDPNHTAEEIAAQCSDHFYNIEVQRQIDLTGIATAKLKDATFGVMQPTGDRFAGGSIDRIAGSPWLGREWCLRANGGRGPFWPEFTHMFGDECIKRTAEKLGVYWARPDLVHFHQHYQRETDAIDSNAVYRRPPPHLDQWNTKQHWDEMQAIFRRLEAEDFKSCMPLT